MEQDLTKGSIKHHYLTYLCAAFGSAMVACVYGMVDAAAVGQYQGPDGAATLPSSCHMDDFIQLGAAHRYWRQR